MLMAAAPHPIILEKDKIHKANGRQNMTITIPFAYIILSLFVAYCGRYRRFGFWGYFFACLLLTPCIGAVLVIASDSQKIDKN